MKKLIVSLCIISCGISAATAQTIHPLKQWNTTQILGGDWKQLEQRDMQFVRSLDADRLLYFFRERVGTPQPNGCKPYGGMGID